MLARKDTGITTIANRLMATVNPENTTARPAEFMARATASWLGWPWARSSRQRVTTRSA